MSELILKYDDCDDMSTYSYRVVSELFEERERLAKLAKRARDFDITFMRILQDRKIITKEEYDAYISYYRHTNLTANEVSYKIWK